MSEPARRTEVVPQLSVRRGRAAIAFYEQAFGAVVEYQVGGTDEHQEVVAQLAIDGATFWVADESPAQQNHSPESLDGGSVRMLLQTSDPDAAIERAVGAGATLVYGAEDAHGWRLGRVVAPFGHHWEIGRPLVAWPPARR